MAKKKITKTNAIATKQATIKKRQLQQKIKVLEQLETMPIILAACNKAGVSKATFYRWKKEDPVFERNISIAHEEGVRFMNDMVESKLLNKIKEENLTAIIFWLKNRHKEYADKLTHNHKHQVEPLSATRKAEIAKALINWTGVLQKKNKRR